MAMTTPAGIDNSKFFINPDQKDHENFVKDDLERITADEMTVHLKSVDIFIFHLGDRIVEAGKPVNYVFILLNGHAGVYQTSDNGQTYVQIDRLFKSNFIGALDLFHGRNYGATVIAGVLLSVQ